MVCNMQEVGILKYHEIPIFSASIHFAAELHKEIICSSFTALYEEKNTFTSCISSRMNHLLFFEYFYIAIRFFLL